MGTNKKSQIRKDILGLRHHLSPDACSSAQEKIFSALLSFSLEKNIVNSKNIMLYMDFKNEVSTKKLMDYIFFTHKTAILPSIESGQILPYVVTDPQDFKKDAYGILSPDPLHCSLIDPSRIDFILIPGVAFDVSGNRLGFGKGYYDRFLPKLSPNVPKVALAYDFQIVKNIPAGEFDIPMDYIITPTRVITCI